MRLSVSTRGGRNVYLGEVTDEHAEAILSLFENRMSSANGGGSVRVDLPDGTYVFNTSHVTMVRAYD